MKLRIITIKFEKPLSEEQENYLIGYLKSIPDGIVEAIDKRIHKMKKGWQFAPIRKFKGAAVDMGSSYLELYRNKIRQYVRLENPEEGRYAFIYPIEDMTLLKAKLAGKKIRIGKLIADKHIKNLLIKHIFPKMKIDPKTVEISYEDKET